MKCNRRFYLFILISIQIFVLTYGATIEDPDLCSKEEIDVCKTKDLQCCVSKNNQCCNDDEYFDQWPSLEMSDAQPKNIVKGIMKMVGMIIGAAVFVILVCCVCCFCCPFCLFSKSREGRVYRQGPADANAGAGQQQPLQAQPPPQPGVQIPVNPSYPGYPQQAQAYPVPPQYPQQSMPYPDDPPPYPGPPLDQAPPLETKGEYTRQPAYNPNP